MIKKGDIVKLNMALLDIYKAWYNRQDVFSFYFVNDKEDENRRWIVTDHWTLRGIPPNDMGVGFPAGERPLWFLFYEKTED